MLKMIVVTGLSILCVNFVNGQKGSDQWLRLLTGGDHFIDVKKDSLVLRPGGVICAEFRTSYENPELIGPESKQKYRARIDSFEFKDSGQNYRLVGTSFLDSSGNIVLRSTDKQSGWRSRNRLSSRFFSAVSKLAPFGRWNVSSFTYASGEAASGDEPSELQALVGRTIVIEPAHLFIGNSNCPGALLDFRVASDKDLGRYGLSLKDFGITGTEISVIFARCSWKKEYPEQIAVFLESPSKAKLLWDGVFFDIVRPPNAFTP